MKKILLVVLMFLVTCVQAQIPSTLGWYEVPNTKIGDPSLTNDGVLNSNRTVMSAWSGGVMDTLRNRLVVFGGGHNDYGGNELYVYNLSANPITAQRITTACVSSFAFDEYCKGHITPQIPLEPQSRHTYDMISYMANVDSMWTWSRAWDIEHAWAFHFAGPQNFGTGMTQWEPLITPVTKIYSYQPPASVTETIHAAGTQTSEYDPVTGKVFLTDYIQLYTYDPIARRYDAVSSDGTSNIAGNSGSFIIDPIRRKLFMFGNRASLVWDISGNPPYPNSVLFPTTGGDTIVNSTVETPGVAYDPTNGTIVGWAGGNTVYILNPDTRVWTPVTYSGGPGSAQQNGTGGRFSYSAQLGVFVLANAVDQNLFTLRLGNGTPPPPMDTQAPTAPTGLIVTPVSASQVNLSWTASMDNIGVIGYRVERNTMEIGMTSSLSFSDTGLTASTTYAYRVRAIDAAGNLSPYSMVVNGTTQTTPPPMSSILTVGPGKMFPTICLAVSAVQNGNRIEIDGATYSNESCTLNKDNVTMIGVNGKAYMKWGTGDSLTNSMNIPNGKGILIIQGNGDVIENMEFFGAKVADQNGAGIRYEGGDLTVRNSYFHGNENGIMGQGGPLNTLILEYNNFTENGFCPSSCGHNVYIGNMGKLLFRFNRSVDSRQGSHPLKSRANVNEIIGNFLSTQGNNGSLEADFSNGGSVFFSGNTVEQGPNTSNSTLLSWGAEGATNPLPKLQIVDNIFINHRTAGATFIQVVNPIPVITVRYNTFIGPGTILSGASATLGTNTQVQ